MHVSACIANLFRRRQGNCRHVLKTPRCGAAPDGLHSGNPRVCAPTLISQSALHCESTRRPHFAHTRAQHASDALEAPFRLRRGGPLDLSARIDPLPCPVSADSACWSCPSCLGASATAPQKTLPTVIGGFMYVYVCVCICVCICMNE
jgi:hypothetical protein